MLTKNTHFDNKTTKSESTDWKPWEQHKRAKEIVDGLAIIPVSWALTPLKAKQAFRKDWQHEDPVSRDLIRNSLLKGENKTSRRGKPYTAYISGYGLRTGEISGGLLAVDFDGWSAHPLWDAIKGSGVEPVTVSWSSGKEGRKQLLFQIPDPYRQQLKSFTRVALSEFNGLKTKTGEDGKPCEFLEFRYNTVQSVLPPSYHPDTGAYYWINSPAVCEVALAPPWLCEFVLELAQKEQQASIEREAKRLASIERRRLERAKKELSGEINLEDILTESVNRLGLDSYDWNGHNFKESKKSLEGCCPNHHSESGKSFHVNKETLEWYCFGCQVGGHVADYKYFVNTGKTQPRGKDFVQIVKNLARDANVDFSEKPYQNHEKSYQTSQNNKFSNNNTTKQSGEISQAEWLLKFGFGNSIKDAIVNLTRSFKKPEGFGDKPSVTAKKQAKRVKPEYIELKYQFGAIPLKKWVDDNPSFIMPVITYEPGQESAFMSEAVAKGWVELFASDVMGMGKNHRFADLKPSTFFGTEDELEEEANQSKLIMFKVSSRNPDTITEELNTVALPTRSQFGWVFDHNKLTPNGQPTLREAKPGENSDISPNCPKTTEQRLLRDKNLGFGNSHSHGMSDSNPICAACPLLQECKTSGFKAEMKQKLASSFIRTTFDGFPGFKGKYGAFVDEFAANYKPTREITVTLTDFIRTQLLIEQKLPRIAEILKPFFNYHVLLLSGVEGIEKFGKDTHTIKNDLDFTEIIENLEILEDIKKEFDKEVELKKRELSSTLITSERIQQMLPKNFLLTEIDILLGTLPGAVRFVSRKTESGSFTQELKITVPNDRQNDALNNAAFRGYMDATATREQIALKRGINARDILEFKVKEPKSDHVKVIQVADLRIETSERSKKAQKRVNATKFELLRKYGEDNVGFIDWLGNSTLEGYKAYKSAISHFSGSRGSNHYQTMRAIAIYGTPRRNISALLDEYNTLTGKCITIPKSENGQTDWDNLDPDFSEYCQEDTRAEIYQEIGRIRFTRRTSENDLTVYLFTDFDLSFLTERYGMVVHQQSAADITPHAGDANTQIRALVVEAIAKAKTFGQDLSNIWKRENIAKLIGWDGDQSRLSQALGNCRRFVKSLISYLESLVENSHFLDPNRTDFILFTKWLNAPITEAIPELIDMVASEGYLDFYCADFIDFLYTTSIKQQADILGLLLSILPSDAIANIENLLTRPPE